MRGLTRLQGINLSGGQREMTLRRVHTDEIAGQKQRVNIARALYAPAEIIVRLGGELR